MRGILSDADHMKLFNDIHASHGLASKASLANSIIVNTQLLRRLLEIPLLL